MCTSLYSSSTHTPPHSLFGPLSRFSIVFISLSSENVSPPLLYCNLSSLTLSSVFFFWAASPRFVWPRYITITGKPSFNFPLLPFPPPFYPLSSSLAHHSLAPYFHPSSGPLLGLKSTGILPIIHTPDPQPALLLSSCRSPPNWGLLGPHYYFAGRCSLLVTLFFPTSHSFISSLIAALRTIDSYVATNLTLRLVIHLLALARLLEHQRSRLRIP